VPSVVVCLIPWPSWAKAVIVVVVAKTLVTTTTTTTVAASIIINTIAYLVLLAIAKLLRLKPK
jgi:hypothetical protein